MKKIILKLNEFYNKKLEQKISSSIFAGGGIGHYFVKKKMRAWLSQVSGLLLDVGSGTQKWKHFIPYHVYYIPLDYVPVADSCPWRETYPQINADAMNLPIKDESIDAVINTFVLEHVTSPEQLIQEISRVLKKGGLLLLAGPGDILMTHGEPYNYFNMTKFAYKLLLEKNGLCIKEEYFPKKFWVSILSLVYMKIVRNNFYNKNSLLKIFQIVILLISIILSPLLNIIAIFLDYITPFDERGFANYMVLAKKL